VAGGTSLIHSSRRKGPILSRIATFAALGERLELADTVEKVGVAGILKS
jgi:hypothetical protein